jgi:hemoglobin-like flavoprotein
MVPAAQSLGRQHVDFGVVEHHYDTVGIALMDTLADTLGPAFDEATHEAWKRAYATLTAAMKEGASFAIPVRHRDRAGEISAAQGFVARRS